MSAGVLRTRLMLLSLSLLAVALPLLAGEPSSTPEDFQIEQPVYSFKGRKGKPVRVDNPFGDVRARFGGFEGLVEVQATLQRITERGSRLEVEARETEDGIDVTVGFPSDMTDPPRPGDLRDRADLVVFVSEGIPLVIRTGAGLIEAKGLKSDVEARTVAGDIEVRAGTTRVKTFSERGSTSVRIDPGQTERPYELESVVGDITLYLTELAGMKVVAETSGEITTDFSVEIDHRPLEEPDKHATAMVGKGKGRITLRSKRGRVRLLRVPKPPGQGAGEEQETD